MKIENAQPKLAWYRFACLTFIVVVCLSRAVSAEQHPAIINSLPATVFQGNQLFLSDKVVPTRRQVEKKDSPLADNLFVNPIGEGADPWVTLDPTQPRYLWCLSEGNRGISIYTSTRLESLGQKHIVWKAPSQGPYSKQVWAPELHFINDHWYIYFAASDGDNANHLSYVLKSEGNDPLGQYTLHGPLATGEGEDGRSPNLWAIDVTVMQHAGKLFAIWSGWDTADSDRQYLYIAPMKSPTELGGRRVRLCRNDNHPWEFTRYEKEVNTDDKGRGLNEAPQVFTSQGRTFVTYSCGASWLPTYKLGILEFTGKNPLNPKDWVKQATPVFTGTDSTYGVGHSCFVHSLDRKTQWHIYHAKRDREPGWRRTIFIQPLQIDRDGFPLLGQALKTGSATLRPGGQHTLTTIQTLSESLREEVTPRNFSYFGHHQYAKATASGFELGKIPDHPVNEFRCGEKLVHDGQFPADITIAVTIDFLGQKNARDAGLLFRTTGVSVGYDAQRGYFAGLIPRTNLIIFGKMDGETWTELARQKHEFDPKKKQHLAVTCKGDLFTVSINGRKMMSVRDSMYHRGTIGLRVVNTHATFTDLTCSPLGDADQ